MPDPLHSLIGRERELDCLFLGLRNILQKPQFAVFSGPSGIGKSSLLSQFISGVKSEAIFGVMTSCTSDSSNAPLTLILSSFEDIVYQILHLGPTQIQKRHRVLQESTSSYSGILSSYIPNFS